MSQAAKIRLKVGQVELEYEGPESFLKDGLVELLDHAIESASANVGVAHMHSEPRKPEPALETNPSISLDVSTRSIASHLSVESAADLAIAAAAKLTFVDQMPTFSRQQLHDAMKSADGFYKKTFGNNLSSTLQRLVKTDHLRETSTGAFSLSAKERTRLEPSIHEIA